MLAGMPAGHEMHRFAVNFRSAFIFNRILGAWNRGENTENFAEIGLRNPCRRHVYHAGIYHNARVGGLYGLFRGGGVLAVLLTTAVQAKVGKNRDFQASRDDTDL